jgi:hypothetical protein
LEDPDQKANGSILMSGDRPVVISHQFNSDGNFADIRFPVPHASTGVVGYISPVQGAVSTTIPGNHVMGMPASGSPSGWQPFTFGYDFKRHVEVQFRGVDDDVLRFGASNLFESGIEMPAVIDDGALELVKF